MKELGLTLSDVQHFHTLFFDTPTFKASFFVSTRRFPGEQTRIGRLSPPPVGLSSKIKEFTMCAVLTPSSAAADDAVGSGAPKSTAENVDETMEE